MSILHDVNGFSCQMLQITQRSEGYDHQPYIVVAIAVVTG